MYDLFGRFGTGVDFVGVITVLPVFPYSRQPDVPYVRPDTPLANAPAMLFKDSFTVSSRPTTPKTTPPNTGKIGDTIPKKGPLENITASAYLTDRSSVPGGSGLGASMSPECRER
jgi:hypothetical protein